MRPWYFAHPVSDYDTPFEAFTLQRLFRNHVVENPNQPRHLIGYKLLGMEHFYQDVLPACCGCFFVAFPSGHIGASIASEIEYFLEHKLPVFEIVDLSTPFIPTVGIQERRILTREETRGAVKVLKAFGNGGRAYV